MWMFFKLISFSQSDFGQQVERRKGYFVTKIVLTYCEKIVLVVEKNF